MPFAIPKVYCRRKMRWQPEAVSTTPDSSPTCGLACEWSVCLRACAGDRHESCPQYTRESMRLLSCIRPPPSTQSRMQALDMTNLQCEGRPLESLLHLSC